MRISDWSSDVCSSDLDLPLIEDEMRKIVAEKMPIERSVKSRDEAVAFFKGIGERYKAEIIASIPASEDLSLYSQGEFTDLCRGPHGPRPHKPRAFKTGREWWREKVGQYVVITG